MKMLPLLIVIVLLISVIACDSEQTTPSGNGESGGTVSERSNEAAREPTDEKSEPVAETEDRRGARLAGATPPQSTKAGATRTGNEGNERGDTGTERSSEPESQADDSLDQMSFDNLLQLIPLPPDGKYWESVYLNDYERMRVVHGIRGIPNE